MLCSRSSISVEHLVLTREYRLIGVAAADASLDELEHILLREQWGQVTWFLINRNKEAIYHPLRKYESVRHTE